MKLTYLVALLLVLVSCEKNTIAPEEFGDIQGIVLDSETDAPVAGASITTSPPTDAIRSDENGAFQITNVLEGSYTITAEKTGYLNNNVSVSVRSDRLASATLFMNQEDEEDTDISKILSASISKIETTASNDSNFVYVEYAVENISSNNTLTQFEVYFDIETANETLNVSQAGTEISPGQKFFGNFRRYTFDTPAESVTISGLWAPGFR